MIKNRIFKVVAQLTAIMLVFCFGNCIGSHKIGTKTNSKVYRGQDLIESSVVYDTFWGKICKIESTYYLVHVFSMKNESYVSVRIMFGPFMSVFNTLYYGIDGYEIYQSDSEPFVDWHPNARFENDKLSFTTVDGQSVWIEL